FGRIAPSDAATESCFSIRGNRENEFASFQRLRHGNLAISSRQSRQKTTLAQWVRNSSRATNYVAFAGTAGAFGTGACGCSQFTRCFNPVFRTCRFVLEYIA